MLDIYTIKILQNLPFTHNNKLYSLLFGIILSYNSNVILTNLYLRIDCYVRAPRRRFENSVKRATRYTRKGCCKSRLKVTLFKAGIPFIRERDVNVKRERET